MQLRGRLLSAWHAAHNARSLCMMWLNSASAPPAIRLRPCKWPNGVCNWQARTSPTSWIWWRQAMVVSPAA